MKRYTLLIVLLTVPILASAHRSGCHRFHSCPSDHGTYICGDLGYTSGCGTGPTADPTPPTPPTPLTPSMCAGYPATLVGTSGNNVLIGTAGNDVIVGGGGDDTINGLGGDDLICPGLGNDTVEGSTGNDTVIFDDATGPVTANLVLGTASGEGNDVLSNIDNLVGSPFNDHLTGNAGSNFLMGRGGNDVLNGQGGNDIVSFHLSPIGVTANLALGTASGEGSDTLINFENIIGSRFNDSLTGNAGNNILFGLDGNDLLNGAGGTDTADFRFSAAGIIASLASGSGSASGEGSDTLINIENLTGSNLADSLTGNNSANTLDGLSGNDSLTGLDGNDLLLGQTGDDTLNGGNQFDICNGGSQLTTDTAVNCEVVTGVP